MTPEEKNELVEVANAAITVANKFGPLVIEETDGDIPTTLSAAALLLAGFCVQANMPMHDSVGLFMSAYKQAKEDSEDAS